MNLLGGFKQWLRLRKMEQEMTSFAVGMNSSVDIPNDKHLLMFDYDILDLNRVERSVRECQEFWALGPAFLYKTTHGFHAIFFMDQMPYSRVRLIIEYADGIDNLYRYISRFYNKKTLRVAGKYKERDIFFLKVMPGCRLPTRMEREIGMLKYREHCAMSGNAVIFDGERDSADSWLVREN
jgi:hypothetical protein